MVDNILGLLFVTSSSRGRNVFRYPPDPTSPLARLSQPIYPSATYTARDTTIDATARHRLFPRQKSHELGSRGSGSAARHPNSNSNNNNNKWSSSASSAARASRRPHLFRDTSSDGGGGGGAESSRGRGPASTSASASASVSASASASAEQARQGHRPSLGFTQSGSFHSHVTENGSDGYEDEDDSSSSSDDTDYEGLWESSGLSKTTRRLSSGTEGGGGVGGSAAPRALTEIPNNADRGRRASVVDSEATSKPDNRASASGGSRRPTTGKDHFYESQYNNALGYTLDFLSDLLTPPRAACNRKFEVAVDELVFIGHPVSIGVDGRWTYPAEDDEDDAGLGADDRRHPSRGRRMRDTGPGGTGAGSGLGLGLGGNGGGVGSAGAGTGSNGRDSVPLRTVVEHRETSFVKSDVESGVGVGGDSGAQTPTARGHVVKKDDEPPTLNMFHLVLVLDKPDPKPDGADQDGPAASDAYNEAYREIAFKWTAAAFALQVKENWVAKEAWQIAQMRDKAIQEGVPVMECLRQCIELNQLARSLNHLFNALHKIKTKPPNSLFSHLSTTVTVDVASIPITIVVPPRSSDPNLVWAAQRGELEGFSSGDDDDSDDEWGALIAHPNGTLLPKQRLLRVDPWQTLLLLEDDGAESAIQRRKAGPKKKTSRGSETTTTATAKQEEDELLLLETLIAASDVTKPLAELAHALRFDLEGIVIPLARELVQNKRAILVDVVNIRLRSIVLPTTLAEHSSTITQHAVRFQNTFPTLPPLIAFLAMISAAPVPFRDLLPPAIQADVSKREPYVQALIWLLRNDLVVQAHVRARIFASPKVKETAWRRLWRRRRDRWLKTRKLSVTSSNGSSSGYSNSLAAAAVAVVNAAAAEARRSSSPSYSDLVTPRASDATVNPLDAFAPRVPLITATSANGHGTSTVNGGGSIVVAANGSGTGGVGVGVIKTKGLEQAILDYDSDLEMDSDVGEGDVPPTAEPGDSAFAHFTLDENEPAPEDVPTFTGSFIFNPSRAQKDEARWLRVIRESAADAVVASRFDLCVQYFDGLTSFEEIIYRTGLNRRELDRIAQVFKDDIITYIHS